MSDLWMRPVPTPPRRWRSRLLLLAMTAGLLLVVGRGLVAADDHLRVSPPADQASTRGGSAESVVAGRHFVQLTGGGDTGFLAVGTTSMRVPAGTMVSFDPSGLTTSLAGSCPRWHLMARFGGRSMGDTHIVADSWTPGAAAIGGTLGYLVVRPEPMTWVAACYTDDGVPMALPRFAAHIEFTTATPFS